MRTETRANGIIVLKVGSRSITSEHGLEPMQVARTMDACFRAIDTGWAPIVVTSGARALGDVLLESAADRSVSAAFGQLELMQMYRYRADTRRIGTCQMLVSEADLRSPSGMIRLAASLRSACGVGLIPVVNGNDATDSVALNNDDLASAISIMVGAKHLILLTDVPGVYSGEFPNQIVLSSLDRASIRTVRTVGRSNVGSGGMSRKLESAARAANAGVRVVIVNLESFDIQKAIAGDSKAAGTSIGPWAHSPTDPQQKWLAGVVPAEGRITINRDAESSIRGGSSLFSSGIKRVSGTFGPGSIVEIVDPHRALIARGRSTLSSSLLALIRAMRPEETAGVLFAILTWRVVGVQSSLSRLAQVSERTQYQSAIAAVAALSPQNASSLLGEVLRLVPSHVAISALSDTRRNEGVEAALLTMAEHTAYTNMVNRKELVVFDREC